VETISLRLTSRQWATIDASMDNAAQSSQDQGEDDAAFVAIRQSGWDQVPWVGANQDWPPDIQPIVISLTRTQWEQAIAWMEADDPIYAQLGDYESLELGRDAVRAVRNQLV
jgi:hypothetical protein